MKYCICSIVLIFLFVGCQSNKVLVSGVAKKKVTVKKIVAKNNKIISNFSTATIRSTAKYKDKNQSYSVTTAIRIKKDSIIWISVKILGIPLAKALITPQKVSYYEKINNTYFEGDFSMLSNWLGTELNYNKVQNLFLGKPIETIQHQLYTASIKDELHYLSEKEPKNFIKTFFFEGNHFLLKKEQIKQPQTQSVVTVDYPNYAQYEKWIMPTEINITAQQKDTITLEIMYKNITFNEQVKFPFSIPSGYKRIFPYIN